MDLKAFAAILKAEEKSIETMIKHLKKDIDSDQVKALVETHGERLKQLTNNAFPTDNDETSDDDTPIKKPTSKKNSNITPTKRTTPSSPPTAKKARSASSATTNTPTRSAPIAFNPAGGSSLSSGPHRINGGARMMQPAGAAKLFGRHSASIRARSLGSSMNVASDDSEGSLEADNESTPRK